MTHDRFRFLLVALVLCGGCRIEVPALAQPHTDLDPLGEAGVVRVRTDVVSMFLIPNERATILVDAGLDPKGEAILKALAASHLGPDDVKAVFITHAHADHVSAAALFRNARFYAFTAPSELADVIDPSRLTTLIDGQATVVEGTTVKSYAVPGHTNDGAAFVTRGVLFLGDAATSTGGAKCLRAAPWIFSGNDRRRDERGENVAALKQLLGRLGASREDVRVVAMAHSDPVTGLGPLACAE
jgi:glyoxylase-like metal-dependent hydrolase (beta-lactamase superfamily II)